MFLVDDVVDGYKIPKGTTVLLNVWGLHHEQKGVPGSLSPFTFDPDRFVGRTSPAATFAASKDYEARDHYGYGAGRRLCPGIHLAERNLFIGMAKLLWAFTLEEKAGVDSVDVNPKTGYSEGFLHCAKPFACKVTVRGKVDAEIEKRREIVLAEFKTAGHVFEIFN